MIVSWNKKARFFDILESLTDSRTLAVLGEKLRRSVVTAAVSVQSSRAL